eukprot:6849764-Pyramimonas_sp.AAC.1
MSSSPGGSWTGKGAAARLLGPPAAMAFASDRAWSRVGSPDWPSCCPSASAKSLLSTQASQTSRGAAESR